MIEAGALHLYSRALTDTGMPEGPMAVSSQKSLPNAASQGCQGVSLCAGVIGVLVRLLWPKMRKRSGRLGGKGAPGSARAAILNFFTALEPAELRPLLAQFLAPVGAAIRSEPPFAEGIEQVNRYGVMQHQNPYCKGSPRLPFTGACESQSYASLIGTCESQYFVSLYSFQGIL